MQKLETHVLKNKQVSSSFYVLTVEAPGFETVSPGQFVQILCRKDWQSAPFLRRPFSVMDQRGAQLDIVYKVIGPGTKHMSALNPGDSISLLGPLGHGFTVDRMKDSNTLIIAGGTGLGGIYFLSKTLASEGQQQKLLYGVRFREEIAAELLDNLAVDYQVIVEQEDGYMTDKGLPELDLSSFSHCCICGPTPMMRAAANAVSDSINHVEVSLEEMMGCGFGICYTCPVKKADGDSYFGACYDGPVFNHKAIAL
jgi:dihydroorotate dehydrogenase electron transfer subunit